MTAINENQVKTLEQTRQRLLHLTHSLESLTGSLHQSDPLPSWSSLQSQASIISNNLTNICSQLVEHQELLSSLVVYPAPTFPGTTQQNVLEQLLRTKLEPRVEDWVTRGRIKGIEASSINENNGGSGNGNGNGNGNGLSEAELAELWSWAPIEANSEARRRNWGGNYTLEEKEMGIQNVVTGLLRPLPDDDEEDEDEDDEGEDEDEEDEEFENVNGDAGERMEIVGVHTRPGTSAVEFDIARERDHVQSIITTTTVPALPLDEVFRFMMTGAKPKSGIA